MPDVEDGPLPLSVDEDNQVNEVGMRAEKAAKSIVTTVRKTRIGNINELAAGDHIVYFERANEQYNTNEHAIVMETTVGSRPGRNRVTIMKAKKDGNGPRGVKVEANIAFHEHTIDRVEYSEGAHLPANLTTRLAELHDGEFKFRGTENFARLCKQGYGWNRQAKEFVKHVVRLGSKAVVDVFTLGVTTLLNWGHRSQRLVSSFLARHATSNVTISVERIGTLVGVIIEGTFFAIEVLGSLQKYLSGEISWDDFTNHAFKSFTTTTGSIIGSLVGAAFGVPIIGRLAGGALGSWIGAGLPRWSS